MRAPNQVVTHTPGSSTFPVPLLGERPDRSTVFWLNNFMNPLSEYPTPEEIYFLYSLTY